MNNREAFEAWWEEHDECNYFDAWEAWKASRKQLLKELSQQEPVAWRFAHKSSYFWTLTHTEPEENNDVDISPLIIRPTAE